MSRKEKGAFFSLNLDNLQALGQIIDQLQMNAQICKQLVIFVCVTNAHLSVATLSFFLCVCLSVFPEHISVNI